MDIIEIPEVQHVEPVEYDNEYRERFKTPFQETMRFNDKFKSTFFKHNTTDVYETKPLADGFIKYNLE